MQENTITPDRPLVRGSIEGVIRITHESKPDSVIKQLLDSLQKFIASIDNSPGFRPLFFSAGNWVGWRMVELEAYFRGVNVPHPKIPIGVQWIGHNDTPSGKFISEWVPFLDQHAHADIKEKIETLITKEVKAHASLHMDRQ